MAMNEQALYNIWKYRIPRGINKSGNTIVNTLSYMRMEAQLGSTNSINFNPLVSQGSQNSTEVRLSQNDSFTILSYGFFLYKQPEVSGALVPNGICVLHTWPNPFVFTGTGEAANLEELYNGQFQQIINTTQFFKSFDMLRFKRVGVAQQGLDVTAPGSGINAAYGQDFWPDGHWGMHDTTPTVTIKGTDTITNTIVTPDALNLGGSSGSINWAVLYFRGYLNQNGASWVEHSHPHHNERVNMGLAAAAPAE